MDKQSLNLESELLEAESRWARFLRNPCYLELIAWATKLKADSERRLAQDINFATPADIAQASRLQGTVRTLDLVIAQAQQRYDDIQSQLQGDTAC